MEIQTSYKDGSIIKGIDAAIERLEVIIRTQLGSFSPDPGFGASLDAYIDEPNNRDTLQGISSGILKATRKYCPEINITELNIYSTTQNEMNVEITVSYSKESGTKTFVLSI